MADKTHDHGGGQAGAGPASLPHPELQRLGRLAADAAAAGVGTGGLSSAAQLLSGMPLQNAMLVAICAAFYWIVTVGIPAHLAQIQTGYEKINAQNNVTLEKLGAAHSAEVKELQQGFAAQAKHTEDLLRELCRRPTAGGSP